MLNALTDVRFWEQTGHLTNRCLPISIYESKRRLCYPFFGH